MKKKRYWFFVQLKMLIYLKYELFELYRSFYYAIETYLAFKFVANDRKLFEGIITDLFPDVKLSAYDYNQFIEALKSSFELMKLEYNDLILERIIQVTSNKNF